MNTIFAVLLAALSTTAHAYEPSWDGNHPEAQSEAWTWMGHVSLLETRNGQPALGRDGFGYIFYYTRSVEPQMGTLTFRSSALTTTRDAVGTKFKTDTVYQAEYDDGNALWARQGRLDLRFKAGVVDDRVTGVPMTAADQKTLNETLKLFPGLKVSPGFAPKKTVFHEVERDGTVIDLVFYSIWPVLSAPGGQMRFLGQDDTYTFSEPMMVTTGTWGGKPVAGLSFLDRQWALNSFGEFVMNGVATLLQYGQALNFAHSWSAFHAYNPRTNEWSFFHLWHQWRRRPNLADTMDTYSGMLYMRANGTKFDLIPATDYQWTPSGFVLNQGRQVMMNYADGIDGFFASRADVTAKTIGLKYTLYAAPALQNLNQPIPFYEGFASGEGQWEGDRIVLQGRLESSRLLFRDQDYQEILNTLKTAEWPQDQLRQFLEAQLANTTRHWLYERWKIIESLLGNMSLKMGVLKDIITGSKPKLDPTDPQVMIYE